MIRTVPHVEQMPPVAVDRRPKRWTREEYQRLADLGFFGDQKVELLEGEIVPMSPQNEPHVVAADKLIDVLKAIRPKGTWTRFASSLDVGADSVPEPDGALVAGIRDPNAKRPNTALLVVEVSDSTLSDDRGRKARLYASAGIREYWIVNLVDRQLEVHRKPLPDHARLRGRPYGETTVLAEGEFVRPLAVPKAKVAVADLLP